MDEPGGLWLYRTKPREDELFSSWLVRLAHGLAVKVQSFVVGMLRMSPGFWTGDVDRNPSGPTLKILSASTSVPLERLENIGLSAYAGYLWPTYRSKGHLAWVMPVGRYGRRRRDHGQQYCRLCLLADEQPYFRRRWRLAFNVVCELHGILLDDSCRICGAPVEFHAGDFGKRLLDLECPITRCHTCVADFRFAIPEADRVAPAEILTLQSSLNELVTNGWSLSVPGGRSYSFLAFEGLRFIVRLLVSTGRPRRIRDLLLCQGGNLPLNVSTSRPQPQFEELLLGDRLLVLTWCQEILRSWPENFVRLCREARVSSSYILDHQAAAPFWLASVVRQHLTDTDYHPTVQEREAAMSWATSHGHSITTNAIRRLLGLSHTRPRNQVPRPANAQRWNPRGRGC